MAKKQADNSTKAPAVLDAHSTASERDAANRDHHQSLVQHTLDMSDYNEHGHATGSQGAKGHAMPPSHSHMQPHSYIPQSVLPANRQNQFSDGDSADANPQGSDDYGSVDNAG
jgi:hypothetical protein